MAPSIGILLLIESIGILLLIEESCMPIDPFTKRCLLEGPKQLAQGVNFIEVSLMLHDACGIS